MIQLNPAAAANILSSAVAQMHGGTSILVNPNASNVDIKALASNVLSQNNKRIAAVQPSNVESLASAESKPSEVAAGSSVKTQNVNNENAVPNDAGNNENVASEGNKLTQNDETLEEGDSGQTVKLANLPNTTVNVVATNNESSVVPLTVGECTIKAISNN